MSMLWKALIFFIIAAAGSVCNAREPTFCSYIGNSEFVEDLHYSLSHSERCVSMTRGEKCDGIEFARWKTDIDVNILIDPRLKMEKSAIFDTIARISKQINGSLNVTMSLQKEKAGNLVIIYADDYTVELVRRFSLFKPIGDFEKLLDSNDICLSRNYIGSENNILATRVFIPPSGSIADIELCVVEEVFNSMGLIADPKGSASFFDKWPLAIDNSGNLILSETHLAMLDLTYTIDPRVYPSAKELYNAGKNFCGEQN